MPRATPFARTLDGLIEFGWLFLIVAVPNFFNVRDYRVFEPDKIVLLRNVVLVMVLLLLLRYLYQAPFYLARGRAEPGGGDAPIAASGGFASRLRRWPIVAAAAVFAAIYLLATIHSIIPSISFWGSYDRLEGFYTYANYLAVFAIFATQVRSWQQIERLVTAVIVSSIPVAAYSWLQHFSQDPLVWGNGAETALRTPSTLGNPIFEAAYVLMAVPFTLYRLVLRLQRLLPAAGARAREGGTAWQLAGTGGYACALILQMVAIGFSASRGPALGFLAALVVFGLSLAARQRITWLLRASVVFAVALVLLLGVTNTVLRSASTPSGGLNRFLHVLPNQSDTSEVRSLLWKSSLKLAGSHPLLGCGPEVLLFCWYPDYPPELRKIESQNAAPDRSHDEEIDVLLMSGMLGLLAYLGVLATSIWVLVRLVRSAIDFRSATFACALLAAFVGHIAEGATGIAFSATLLLLWSIAGVATALRSGSAGAAGAHYVPGDGTARGVEGGVHAAAPGHEPLAVPVAAAMAADRGGGRSSGSASVALGGGGGKRRQQSPRQSQREPQRRPEPRARGYAFGASLERLTGGGKALVGVGAIALVAAAIGGAVLFAQNVQVVMADVDYRAGQNYEQAAGQYAAGSVAQQARGGDRTAAYNYQQGLGFYQTAIADYQQALDKAPTQDTYFLFLGKTMLEYAGALNVDPSRATTAAAAAQKRADVVAEIEQSLAVFERASRNNPLNPDHPRNIAKLYDFWGYQAFGRADVAKLVLADRSFARASALAPHNADILDEWAVLDLTLGARDQPRIHGWYAQALAHLQRARDLFPEDGNVYRDLGTVYSQFAQWAVQAKQTAQATMYYNAVRDSWLKALGAPPVTSAAGNYPAIYPRLSRLYLEKYKDLCTGGQYALYALNTADQWAFSGSDAQLKAGLQSALTAARASKTCHLKP